MRSCGGTLPPGNRGGILAPLLLEGEALWRSPADKAGQGGIAISSSAPCAFALCAPCGCTAAALQSRYARPTRALIVFSGTPLYRRCSAIGMKAAGRGVLTQRSAARGIVCFIAFFCGIAARRRWEAGRTRAAARFLPPHRRRSNARLPSCAIVPHPAPRRVRSAIPASALTVRRPGGRPLHTLTYAPTCSPPESAARPAQTRRVHLFPPCRRHTRER